MHWLGRRSCLEHLVVLLFITILYPNSSYQQNKELPALPKGLWEWGNPLIEWTKVYDVNGDGINDLVYVRCDSRESMGSTNMIFLGTGTGYCYYSCACALQFGCDVDSGSAMSCSKYKSNVPVCASSMFVKRDWLNEYEVAEYLQIAVEEVVELLEARELRGRKINFKPAINKEQAAINNNNNSTMLLPTRSFEAYIPKGAWRVLKSNVQAFLEG